MSLLPLDPRARDHLCKLLNLLSSDQGGERAAAGWKANEFLKRRGLQWSDVICCDDVDTDAQNTRTRARPLWHDMLDACLAAEAMLNEKERAFLHSMQTWRGWPTDKQMSWLEAIHTVVAT